MRSKESHETREGREEEKERDKRRIEGGLERSQGYVRGRVGRARWRRVGR